MSDQLINWGTVGGSGVLALIIAIAPILLGGLLNRKNANKKLNLDETSVMIAGTESQIKTYQDLLNRAQAAVEKAETLNTTLTERISKLETTKDNQEWQIKTLRDLFKRVVDRSNVTLTKEEQEEFDRTMPTTEFRRIYKSQSG